MKPLSFVSCVSLAALSSLPACGDDPAPKEATGGSGQTAQIGDELRVAVPASGAERVYVTLSPLQAVPATGTEPPAAWDLSFQGYEIFTNGGASGAGKGTVFGPLEVETFATNAPPPVPFRIADKASGAFLQWYLYEGAPSHVLWSRYHTIGVRDGERTWKVQILSYYGERDGAPIGGLYQLRWAEITAGGVGETKELRNIDATAGGPAAPPTAPSGCVDLATGQTNELTPDAALASNDWHLCFRRQNVILNGGLGGPRGVSAFDPQGAATDGEVLADVKKRTAESELAAFDAVGAAMLANQPFAVDKIASGFGTGWLDDAVARPTTPKAGTWIVQDAAGRDYFLGFTRFEGASATSPGTVVLQTKALAQ